MNVLTHVCCISYRSVQLQLSLPFLFGFSPLYCASLSQFLVIYWVSVQGVLDDELGLVKAIVARFLCILALLKRFGVANVSLLSLVLNDQLNYHLH